ncbi:MAG: DUF4357 domain-containing protein [Acidobacteria bacterium]|nr:DUF4357 domain-containing protein [Acidobacteriota bacterium]
MTSATIKLFLPHGDPKRLRTAEISNWNGKAVAAPRTDLDALLQRDEARKPGVYLLIGKDEATSRTKVYVGEAEAIGSRLKQHRSREFWVHVIFFVSQHDNLTKAHIRHLEGRLVEEVQSAGRATLENVVSSGSLLPESDRADMDVFLSRIRQLLPILNSDILTPVLGVEPEKDSEGLLFCESKGLRASGRRTAEGFAVLAGSQAALEPRRSAGTQHPWVLGLRKRLLDEGVLQPNAGHLPFTRDHEFASPSAAAAVIQGGGANGPVAWKNQHGTTLKELDAAQE